MWRIAFVWALTCVWMASARADQVTLKNGDRLTGTIVKSEDTKTLLIKTEFAGDVTVKWEAIASIESGQTLHVKLKSGQTLAGPVKTEDGKLEVATPANGTVVAPKDTILAVRNDAEEAAYQRQLHPHFVDLWGGLLDTGLSLTRGNSRTVSYTLAGKAARTSKRNKFSMFATGVYANDDTTPPSRTTANAWSGGVRDDFNISPRVFVFGFTQFDSNEFQNLDLRNTIGGGFGYHVIDTANTKFDVFGGATFNRENFSAIPPVPPATVGTPAITRKTSEVVVGETFNWKMSGRTTLTEAFSIYPNTSDLGQYRFSLDATAATKLKNWLSWQVTYSDRYLSNPVGNKLRNDLLLSTGLRLTYGKGAL